MGNRTLLKKLKLSNGCEVAYMDEGRGTETLLFIHGLATYGRCWRNNIDQLKTRYRCIAIDLPGNGFSDKADYPYSISFFAGCVFDFIRHAGLKNVTLVGHSMGGQIAMTLLLNEPTAAKKLVLCATAGFETFNAFEKNVYSSTLGILNYFTTDEMNLRDSIRNSFYHYPAQADDMIKELVDIINSYPPKGYKTMLEGCIKGMLNETVFDRLQDIKQPTLVLFGDRDALVPNRLLHPTTTKAIAEQGIKKMPNATLKMLPQCGHFLQWEQAKIVNEEIEKFVG
jgi:pimeloyl-ACP methyl ester carboxylesterase